MVDYVLPLLAAPFIGSFAGVLIRRLPARRPVLLSRSACDGCGRVLPWSALVPMLSYAAARGRCRACGAAIGRFHLAVEVAALGLALMVVLADGASRRLWPDCGLAWTLLTLAWIDWEHGRLPDALTLPLLVAGLVSTWWLEPWAVLDHAAGAVAGYLVFRLIALAYSAWRGREGLGHGDAKLLACAGAWVGWQGLDQVVLLGALATIGATLYAGRNRPLSGATAVPFGPGLALGILAVRLTG